MQLDLFAPAGTHSISKITYKQAVAFLSIHHYLRGVSLSAMCYGVFIDGSLVAVVAFGTPCSENVRASVLGPEYKNNVAELARLAIDHSHNPTPPPASKIVSDCIREFNRERALRQMPPIKALISFADSAEGHHGGVYQSMSWLYCGTSDRGLSTSYIDQDGRTRHPRQVGVNISREQAAALGWSVVQRPSLKHRYIKLIGSKLERKALSRLLKLSVLPYPKPNPAAYDP